MLAQDIALQNVRKTSQSIDDSANNIANSLLPRTMPYDVIDIDFTDPAIKAICGVHELVSHSALSVNVAATITNAHQRLFKLL